MFFSNNNKKSNLALKFKEELEYSPVQCLPTQIVYLPHLTVKRPTIYFENDSNEIKPKIINKTPSPKKKLKKI